MSDWNDKAIIAVVSRLTPQKGVHLIKHAAYKVRHKAAQMLKAGVRHLGMAHTGQPRGLLCTQLSGLA